MGTSLNLLVKLVGAGQVKLLATSDSAGAVGVVVSNPGKVGFAGVAVGGRAPLLFDGPATANHYVVISSTTAGRGHDAGTVCPSSAQVIGRVLNTISAAGATSILFGSDCGVVSGGSGGGGGSSNATALNGVPLSGVPQAGQAYLFDGSSSTFVPIAVPFWRKFTVGFAQVKIFNATTGTINIAARAARQKVCGMNVSVTSAFAGASIAAISASVGDSNGTNSQYTRISTDLLDNGQSDFNVMGSPNGSSNIQATFSSTGANLSALTAGSVDISVCLANLP